MPNPQPRSGTATAQPHPAILQGQMASPEEAQEIARDAYIYAYPLVLMELTRRQMTNYATQPGNIPGVGPLNRFIHVREFPDPAMKIVIRPNADTLYSSAWLDLDAEPIVLSVPAVDRYFLLPILSMWTDVFAVPGTRTTGPNCARLFLICGPNWKGTVPQGMEAIKSPTRYVWIIGRTQANGKSDYDNVHRIQDQYNLTPLGAWGNKNYVPPEGKVDPKVDMTTPPPAQVDKMDAATFVELFTRTLKDNPPRSDDYPMIHRLERIGMFPDEDFQLKAAPPAMRAAIERGFQDGAKTIALEGRRALGGGGSSEWSYRIAGGDYGVDYLFRAIIARFGLGANLPQDAVYPAAMRDSEGRVFDGNERYVMRFEKGKLPPVNAFWSLTAYDPDGYFIPNSLQRQALGDRDNLKKNPDGSVDIYFGSESPGRERESNWLPTGQGPFNILLRMYSPKAAMLNGSWTPPPVKRMKSS